MKPDLPPGTPPRPSGLGYALRRTWVPPQTVTITGYAPMPGSLSGVYLPQAVQVPGFYVTETTTGVIHHSHWVLEQRNLGVYGWQLVPDTFMPR